MLALSLLLWVLPFGASADAAPLNDLVSSIERNGEDDPWPGELAEMAGFIGEQASRLVSVPMTADGVERGIRVIGERGKPVAVVVLYGFVDRKGLKTRYTAYRVGLDGTLERATESQGLIDPSGEGVPGSAKDVPLDIKSPFVKKPFRKELDFWLKRLNGKKPKKTRASSKQAAGSDLATAK